ncbi:hypothetical protein ACIRQP_40640 [Streptomyces sp. NPDC102274]|uniref:hypothetical protein n=1 Tax=Streptomyces sp. NPDC102274 TaxID=3366151 RepID=UPI00382C0614
MPARGVSQGLTWEQVREGQPLAAEEPFGRVLAQLHQDVSLLFALRVIRPDIRVHTLAADEGVNAWEYNGRPSWAMIEVDKGGTATARHGGPRRLADELDAA